MRWSLFASRIERRVAIALVFANMVPIVIVSIVAMDQVTRESARMTQLQLQRVTQDYSGLIHGRLVRAAGNMDAFRPTILAPTTAQPGKSREISRERTRPTITHDEGLGDVLTIQFVENDIRYEQNIELAALSADAGEVAGVSRCIGIGADSCSQHKSGLTDQAITVRLDEAFDADLVVRVSSAESQPGTLYRTSAVTAALPYFMFFFATLITIAVIMYLRKQFRPMAEFKTAIQSVDHGHFARRVEVTTNDEFGVLGQAFNSMSGKLEDSFGFLQQLSDIDEQILSGAKISDVTDAVCLASIRYAGVPNAAVAISTDGVWRITGFLNGKPWECQRSDTGRVEDLFGSLREFRKVESYPILQGRQRVGFLIVDGSRGANAEMLQEVSRKVAVALANIGRGDELFRQATFDGLTGLLNRIAFILQLENLVANTKRASGDGVLLFLDLDRFKRINDTEGHLAGDHVLCTVAERLLHCVRETDVVARLGGDEFAIALASYGDHDDLLHLLRRVIKEVEKPIQLGELQHAVSVSIGVCSFPEDGTDAESLLKSADIAMYRAKRTTGGSYVFFDEALNEEAERRVLVESRLRSAVEQGLLELHLQAKLHVATNRIEAFEALLRWTDSELGVMSPYEFVDVAEKSGLIEILTDIVVRQTAVVLAQCIDLKSVAINLSPLQILSDGFPDSFLRSLDQHGCDPRRIEVEITESVFISNPTLVGERLVALKKHGIRVSLDDFGTGFSSLNLLRQLPLDAMKIDKSFIDDLESNAEARLMVAKIVELAAGLDIEVIAEGVENEQQLQLLRAMGCHYVQGYHIFRPVIAEQAVKCIGQWLPDESTGSAVADNRTDALRPRLVQPRG